MEVLSVETMNAWKKREQKHIVGDIPYHPGESYSSQSIVNRLGTDLYVKDRFGNVKIIAPSPNSQRYYQFVEISKRTIKGHRTFDRGRADSTPSDLERIKIPYEELVGKAIHVPLLDVVIYMDSHLDIVHPGGDEIIQRRLRDLSNSQLEMAGDTPISIQVNDPSGVNDYLYLELHGHICSVPVTNYNSRGEADSVKIVYRDKPTKFNDGMTVINTTIAELTKASGAVWHVNGYAMSLNRELLKLHMDKKKQQKLGTAKVEQDSFEIAQCLKDMEEDHKQRTSVLTKEIKALQDKTAQYEKLLDQEGDPLHRQEILRLKQEIELQKIALEKEKLSKTERKEIALSIINGLTQCMKFLAVAVPAAIAISKAIDKAKG